MQTQLYFWKPLIEKYKEELSLVEKYYIRTNDCFNNIEKEAEDYANSLYRRYPATEDTDPTAVAEWAFEKGIEMYETLSIMKSNHLLMTISMLYHIWEQQLIKFTINELEHYLEFDKKSLEFEEVQKIFELHGVDITKTEVWKKIRELKALVNTIKHGDGYSADKLRKIRPDFFEADVIKGTDTLELYGAVLLDEYSLQVNESDLFEYINAVKSFWDEMPERAFSDVDTIINTFTLKK
ncbi:hypothetical protein Thert_01756 [Thermoanaerobacterium thermosaccharolyticum]|uniref:Uncharacterized protein n=1 Tax=Thermoanaerobacterium thermosaccharolyticum TaxID=1517 RepID=A0A223HZ48_THETR|nr:hypothetical protein [Thermoanaerobacterium thermosaccharolyticum]AST57750.1 hypothetical protein Thert_01756 [Thermoanaerobacterium thermosaccharolyticum]